MYNLSDTKMSLMWFPLENLKSSEDNIYSIILYTDNTTAKKTDMMNNFFSLS
ncbi:hypothetical protein GCM10011364_06220 [Mangrovimonas yunxiaonensis]|nr:hypothetical protein GCM10011364_06220 [Mangrovimonas yunxiaonensis]